MVIYNLITRVRSKKKIRLLNENGTYLGHTLEHIFAQNNVLHRVKIEKKFGSRLIEDWHTSL